MFMERKKQRGQYIKLKSMFKAIDRFTPFERSVVKCRNTGLLLFRIGI